MAPSATSGHAAGSPTFIARPARFFETALELRLASRESSFTSITSGQAPGHVQASPVILPSRYAADFRRLCARNPVPCPLLAESASRGCFTRLKSWMDGVSDDAIAADVDIRRDTPRYMVFQDGVLVKSDCTDVVEEWTEDHVAFLIGCSYSFETALTSAGLPPPHVVMGLNCPMYRTKIPLCPAGVFTDATYVVSMRYYTKSDVPRARAVTRPFSKTHGEPIAWGWDAVQRLGIVNISCPEWGDGPLTRDGRPLGEAEGDEEHIPVFWGCGVTPQEAVARAKLKGTVMCHSPGHILVLDLQDSAIVELE